MTPKEEKLEEIRQDMLIEEKLRQDLDFAIERFDVNKKLEECINYLEKLSNRLTLYDWEVTPKDIINRLL